MVARGRPFVKYAGQMFRRLECRIGPMVGAKRAVTSLLLAYKRVGRNRSAELTVVSVDSVPVVGPATAAHMIVGLDDDPVVVREVLRDEHVIREPVQGGSAGVDGRPRSASR